MGRAGHRDSAASLPAALLCLRGTSILCPTWEDARQTDNHTMDLFTDTQPGRRAWEQVRLSAYTEAQAGATPSPPYNAVLSAHSLLSILLSTPSLALLPHHELLSYYTER